MWVVVLSQRRQLNFTNTQLFLKASLLGSASHSAGGRILGLPTYFNVLCTNLLVNVFAMGITFSWVAQSLSCVTVDYCCCVARGILVPDCY